MSVVEMSSQIHECPNYMEDIIVSRADRDYVVANMNKRFLEFKFPQVTECQNGSPQHSYTFHQHGMTEKEADTSNAL